MEEGQNQLLLNLFICPITHEIMENPVITVDGQSYEKSAIQTWLNNGNKTSPITGLILKSKKLTENYNLKSIINLFKPNPSLLVALKNSTPKLPKDESKKYFF